MTMRGGSGLMSEAHADTFIVNGLDASDFGDVLIDSLRAGKVGACLVSSSSNGVGLFQSLDSPHHRYLNAHPDRITLARSVADIERARREGRIAIILGLQVADMIGEDLGQLTGLHAMGLRSCGLSYNVGNYVGSGCTELDQGPLSRFGVAFVEALQSLRIAVDIGGHGSEETAFDALRHTTGPVVCTHTAVRALRNTPRAMTDRLFKAIADRVGVVGLAAFSFFLVPQGAGTVADFVRHLDYAVKLVGPDHVGLGLDFILGKNYTGPVNDVATFPPDTYPQQYEGWIYPNGLTDFTGLATVMDSLVKLNYTPENIAKVMGGNWMRVWREVWGA